MSHSEQQQVTISSSLDSLSEFIKQESSDRRGRSIPPLDKWYPERQGEMDKLAAGIVVVEHS